MNSRILVTGGAGYIGSVTAAHLLDAGHQVVVYDDLRVGRRAAVPPQATFVQGNIADRTRLDAVLATDIDGCVHFAASAEAGESMQHPEAYFDNNTAGTIILLERLLHHGVKRFVFSSTCAVYGQPDVVPIDETTATSPVNAYGASKLLIEQALVWLHDLRGLSYAALRYFNAAGAWESHAEPGSGQPKWYGEWHHPESHLIPIVLSVAAGKRDAISIFGTDYPTEDGTCVRDYVHVADLATAHVAALAALEQQSRIVCNIGTGGGNSVREVIETARRVTGHPIPSVERDRRPGDPPILVASSARAQQLLGWTPGAPSLDQIIASAWTWHQANGWPSG